MDNVCKPSKILPYVDGAVARSQKVLVIGGMPETGVDGFVKVVEPSAGKVFALFGG